jgi:glutamyl/glutaminyl-tRNA synthetase
MGTLLTGAQGRESDHLVAGALYNTAFRPTPYRDLHLGHAWCIYHNWQLPARMGGHMYLILDSEEHRLQRIDSGKDNLSLEQCGERYMEDMAWLGCPADRLCYSSEARPLMLQAAAELGIKEPQIVHPEEPYEGILWRHIVKTGGFCIRYNPWTTLSAVVDHHYFGVTGFCRGMDMVQTAQLYDYLCCRLGWVAPEQYYCSVVRRGWTYQKESKESGGSAAAPTLRELRQMGVTGEQILDTLRELDFQRDQQTRDAIQIPMDVLNLPPKPGVLAYHMKVVPE